MKNRIGFLFNDHKKKKSIFLILTLCMTIFIIGMYVSCGHNPQEAEPQNDIPADTSSDISSNISSDTSSPADTSETSEDPEHTDISETDTQTQAFNYNNDYNKLIRCYNGDVYLSDENGIYLIKNGTGPEELIIENAYCSTRGIEIYDHYLYFSGSLPGEDETSSTIYRMDLNTYEVENMLSDFEQKFEQLYNISVYEDELYASLEFSGLKVGFKLDQNGNITEQLDENAEDFLYKEYNEYMKLEAQRMNAGYDTEEYWKLTEELNEKYIALTDVASCKKILHGNQIVSRYENEAVRNIYLETENGEYKFLCEDIGFPSLVTEEGIYYASTESGDIWFMDYNFDNEPKIPQLFYKSDPMLFKSISLVNYDADYVYLLKSEHIGFDAEDMPLFETYLIRVSRKDGDAEEVYQFEEGFDAFGMMNRIYKHNGIYDNKMYLESHEIINLDPKANGMQTAG